MNSQTRKRIIELHNKHLSIFYIEKHLKEEIPQGIIKQVIEEETKEDFNSLFKGG